VSSGEGLAMTFSLQSTSGHIKGISSSDHSNGAALGVYAFSGLPRVFGFAERSSRGPSRSDHSPSSEMRVVIDLWGGKTTSPSEKMSSNVALWVLNLRALEGGTLANSLPAESSALKVLV